MNQLKTSLRIKKHETRPPTNVPAATPTIPKCRTKMIEVNKLTLTSSIVPNDKYLNFLLDVRTVA